MKITDLSKKQTESHLIYHIQFTPQAIDDLSPLDIAIVLSKKSTGLPNLSIKSNQRH